AAPRDGHRPRLDAAVAIKPLFQRHLADEIVDTDLLRPLDHAVALARPRPQLERLRRLGDVLAHAELVEIVVAGVDLLVGDRPVEREFIVAPDGIEVLGRIGELAGALGERRIRGERQGKRGEAGPGKKAAAVEEQALRRGKACGNLTVETASDTAGLTLR